jgi:hypothetical protein
MAILSVSDFSLFINQQIKAQERIEVCLWRLEALIAVALMTDGFYNLSQSFLHNYFSVVGDLIQEAAKANQASFNELLK